MQVRLPLDTEKYLNCVLQYEIDREISRELNYSPPPWDSMQVVYAYLPPDQTEWLKTTHAQVHVIEDVEYLALEFEDAHVALEFLLKFY